MNKKFFTGKNILLAIKSLMVVIFIILLIRSYYGIEKDYWLANNYDGAFELKLLTDRIIFKAYILPNLIILLPVIGIFISNRIGWILLTSYFYFLLFNGTFYMRVEELMQPIFWVFIATLIFFAGIIFLMNLKAIRSDIYKIPKSQQIINNIFATIIGLIFTLAVALIHNHTPFE